MKLFTDVSGKFQMLIPPEWEYKNPTLYQELDESNPRAFGKYGKMNGAFQISCKLVNTHISELITDRKVPIQASSGKLVFSEWSTKIDQTETYIFMCAVDDHFFLATYIISDVQETSRQNYERELSEVRLALSTVKYIKPEYWEILSAKRRYTLFMHSLAATVDLMNKASVCGCLIEYVALCANRIDALLRLAIILSKQIDENTDVIDIKFLFQAGTDKKIMERTIYRLALDRKLIELPMYEELEQLYKQRNRVIHRYIITDIKTEHIHRIANEYDSILEKIDSIVNSLEGKQFELKIGIHKDINPVPASGDSNISDIIPYIREKHGNIYLEKILGHKVD